MLMPAPPLCRVGRSRTALLVNRVHCCGGAVKPDAGSELHALCPRPRRRGGLWRRGAAGRGGRARGERAGRDRGRRARELDAPVCRRVHCAGRQHAGAGRGGAPERAAGPLGARAPAVHHGPALGQGCARAARRGARAAAPASSLPASQAPKMFPLWPGAAPPPGWRCQCGAPPASSGACTGSARGCLPAAPDGVRLSQVHALRARALRAAESSRHPLPTLLSPFADTEQQNTDVEAMPPPPPPGASARDHVRALARGKGRRSRLAWGMAA